MKTHKRTETYKAAPDIVFQYLDNLEITGMHMTKSSMSMVGSKLKPHFLTANHTGLGSKYNWTGKVMGMNMNFTVEVTKWVKDKEKTWETIGDAKMIIYSWYQMHLVISPLPDGTHADLSISYKKPRGSFNRIICFLLGDLYSTWCLKHMLGDAKQILENEAKRDPTVEEHLLKT